MLSVSDLAKSVRGETDFSHSEWKDSTWRTVPALRRGLTDVDATIRKTLFGPNMIEVASRGIVTILIDEVLHPFYVFQIFSILLWSIDDYYCETKSGAS